MEHKELLITYLKEKGYAKSSIASYVRICEKYYAWAAGRHIETDFVSYSELIDYMASLKKTGITRSSVCHYMIAVTHYYEALSKADIIEHNPARYLELKSRPTRKLYPILSRQQLENLYTTFDVRALRATKPSAKASAIRNKIATGLMVFQGLDTTALAGLRVKDVDVLGGKITINSSRTHAARTLALEAVQIIELDRYINQTRKELQIYTKKEESEILLITGYDQYKDAHRHRVMKRLKRADPQLQSARQIRASVITHWLKQYNLREVQYMAGHRRVLSTERYQRNDTEGLQMDVDRFHPLG